MTTDSAAASGSIDTRQLQKLIVRFIRDELADDPGMEIDPEENLLASGLIDSMGFVRLIAYLGEQLDTVVPPQELVPDNFRTIQVMTSYFESLLQR